MKTNDLVDFLATGDIAVDQQATRKRFVIGITLGVLGATLMMLALLGLRPDLAQAAHQAMFWVKLAFPTTIAAISLVMVARLAHPGRRLQRAPLGLAIPVLVIWLLAIVFAVQAGPNAWLDMLLGPTWAECPFLIAILAVPIFAGLLWVMRGLAPTRLGLAGGSVGLLSGALAAMVYCLHCTEMSAPFIGTWYLLGMLIPAGIGALLGRYLLRW